MRGLLRNNFYSMQEGMKLSFLLTVLLGVLAVFLDYFIVAAITGIIIVFPVNIGASLQSDKASKWNKYEITAPVRRKTIIACKYISYLLLIAIGIACSLIAVAVLAILGNRLDSVHINFFLTGLSLGLLTGAFLYPLLLLDIANCELTVILSAFMAAVCFSAIFFLGVSIFTLGKIMFFDPTVLIMVSIVSIILFALSYLISVCIHRRKEF